VDSSYILDLVYFVADINSLFFFFFFFQAEDGIRDRNVMEFRRVLFRSEGRPLCGPDRGRLPSRRGLLDAQRPPPAAGAAEAEGRSEERRVGKECRSRWEEDHEKKKNRRERVGG